MKPSHFYFSDNIFQKELGLFNQASYLGHEIHLQANNYYCPPHDPGKVLVNNKNGINPRNTPSKTGIVLISPK